MYCRTSCLVHADIPNERIIFVFEQSTNIQNGDADVSHSAQAAVDERTAPTARTSGGRTETAASRASCPTTYPRPEGACQYSECRCTSTGVTSK